MRILGTILAILICCNDLKAEEHFVVGYAPDFPGKKVRLYTFQDYLTMTKIVIGEGEVDPKDSLFKIPVTNNATIKAVVEIENSEAFFYLAPKTNYEIYFPKATGPLSFQNQVSDIIFYGLDSTDINYRILSYHQWFDTFVAFHEREIAAGHFLSYLDTFKIYVANAYKDVKDPYFLTYVRYDIGAMEQTHGGVSGSEGRLNVFMNYIQPFPLYFENDRYMSFVSDFYHQDFQDYPFDIRTLIDSSINIASPTMLMKALRADLFLVNPEIREMIMIIKLGRAYYDYVMPYRKPNVLFMLDSIVNHAKYEVNATIANNVVNYLMNLETGYPAPPLALKNDSGEVINWKRYQGHFVYLNFFITWDDLSKREMTIIKDLKEKYGEDIRFLSICMDKDTSTFNKFLRENPEFDWDIVYVGEDEQIKKSYNLATFPAYHLIDQDGYMAIPNAPRPRPDGEYESIDKVFFYIDKSLHPIEHKRPGDP